MITRKIIKIKDLRKIIDPKDNKKSFDLKRKQVDFFKLTRAIKRKLNTT